MTSNIESELQEQLLQRLGNYADSLLDEEDYQKRLKKAKRKGKSAVTSCKKLSSDLENSEKSNGRDSSLRQLKNKKNKEKNKDMGNKSEGITNRTENDISEKRKIKRKLIGQKRHLSDLKEELGLDGSSFRTNNNEQESKLNVSTNSVEKNHRSPEVIVFEDPAKRKDNMKAKSLISGPGPSLSSVSQSAVGSSGLEFSLRKARWDVLKFGIAGFDKSKKEEAQVALAIKLGAKPKKNKYVNYKNLQEAKKTERDAEEKKREQEQQLGVAKKQKRDAKKRKRDRDDIGFVDGQLGRFRGGVQVLKKTDIDRIKATKVAKKRK
ncbi:uncharacterized protein C1orf131 homolog isoform X1 [Lingula anatina]|uniref:Uncharacterized protein C1orf131 homolog isoform X1 n=1 Tax=Lingula anatina TaxID=7574 RepID=A0A2R2MN83_LINAN|nr:uncharacterized protein C1orf131 homolog isoform X1 [Lingula anatina]|eukprot:XP_023931671.1 uncharacterized protein C1orf131 homolog isoform X1 [Lingula anatina]